ncbi:MAG: hypothetical protein M3Y37_07530 [Chloroflexota bacterium]|nr:hypothetical protein [Chloroflexota bacterium]
MPDLFLQISDGDPASASDAPELPESDAIAVLRDGEIVGSKLIPWGSNYSFAVALETPDGREQLAIYKPRTGENPLYDFPDGTLYLREVAAYELSRMLGWNIVPPTVVKDGPLGIGSLQLYKAPVEPDEESDPRAFWSQCSPEIERLVLFDHIANNADRKLSHCLLDRHGKVWGIDHGLCFNHQFKLRTVLWQFNGGPVSPHLVADLTRVRADTPMLRDKLEPLLNEVELLALLDRMDQMIGYPVYPILNPNRNVPYGWW